MGFLDELYEYTAKSAVVIKDLVLMGDYETATLLMSLQSTANDTNLPDSVRLDALTALINKAGLLDVALPPYYPVEYTFPKTQNYVGLHNDLSGLNTGDYWHLTYAEYTGILNKPSVADINFSNLQTGSAYDSSPLSIALNNKENAIAAGVSGQFFGWDKTMRFVSWANLTGKPSTLSGLGITSADTLFDGKYLSQSSVISSYAIGASIAISNTDTLVGALGKLQAQINTVSSATGTINTVGLIMPSVFSVGNSPLTGIGGTINVSLASQSAKTFFAAPNAGSGTPSFRQIVASDLPTSGVSSGTYGNTTNWPVITVDSYGRITNVSIQSATSGGTVTSVALSAPVEFSVSGSPIISSGTLGFSWANQNANYVMAGPVSGSPDIPGFRALVAADIPNIEMSQVNGLDGYLDGYLPDALANSMMFIGNGSDAAVNATVTGDLSLAYVDNLGANEADFTIVSKAVSYSKIQDVTGQKLLGRYAIASGPVQEITFDPLAFTLNSGTGVLGLVTPNPPTLTTKGDLLTSTGAAQVRLGIGANATFFMADSAASTGNKWVSMGGDATLAVNGDLTIAAGAITLSKMADADGYSFIGNNTASSATPIYLTKAQATTLINSFDAALDLPGLVPNGSGNDSSKFLSGAGTWITVSGGGGTTTNALTIDNSGAGSASGVTFNGASPVTISYNTIGAPKANGAGASGTWSISITGNSATVTNGLYSTGSYSNPTWLTSIQGSIVSGNIAGNAANITATSNSTLTTLSSLSLPGSQVTGNISGNAANVTGTVAVANGGTGQTSYTDGQLLIGNSTGNTLTKSTLTAGSGISITNAGGSITITATGGGGGGVTSFSAGTTGFTPNVATTGAITLAGTLNVANGGTGITSGVSGGVLYFSASGILGSSGQLDQYELMMGGGAGSPPITLNNGSPGSLLISSGLSSAPSWTTASYPSTTSANRILFSSANNVVDEITAPSTADRFLKWDGSAFTWAAASSGSGTVNSGTQYQLAYYASTGTAVSGLTAITASRALASDANGLPVASATTATELGYVSGVTSSIQTQLNTKAVYPGAGIPNSTGSAWGTSYTTTGTGTLVVLQNQPTIYTPLFGDTATTGHAHFRKAGGVAPAGINNYATMFFQDNGGAKRMSILWDALTYQSEFVLDATATRQYTFPDISGTVTLLGNTTTGSGSIVLATSPTLTTPAIGAATGTSLVVTGALTSGVASSAAGELILRNTTSSATQTIRGTDSTTSIVYDLPTTAPTASQVLTASAPIAGVVTLSWTLGSGNVVGPGSSTDGNFAVFSGTSGSILANPSVATLSLTGRATFNDGVDVGVSSSTTGTVVFRNSSNAFTTTIQASTSASGNASYYWPTAQGTAGQILSTDASGNLSWTAAGSGDMTLLGVQTVTGAKTFGSAGNVGKLIVAGSTSGTTIINASAVAGSTTVTLPALTGTVALLENAQTFTGAKTFSTGAFAVSSAATFSGSTTANFTIAGSTTVPQITVNGTTMNWISVSSTGAANPVTGTTPATGTKIRFRAATNTSTLDSGMGLDANSNLYFSTGTQATQSDNRFSFYMPVSTTATEIVRISQNGIALGEILSNPSAGRTGALLVLSNIVTSTSPSYIRFDGFPTGTVTPNSGGANPTARLGSGTRLSFYIPGSGYPTAMGYHNSGGIFMAMANATQFSIFGDAVESFRMTASNNTSSSATISLVNSAGVLSQVLTSRITGYGSPTGGDRTATFAASTNVEKVVAALVTDLKTHGLIG